MKKILEIKNGRGYFLDSHGVYSEITKLSTERLKEFLELVFNDDNNKFDPYDDALIHNAADKIIYNKVVTKLKNIQDSRDEIKSSINAEFSQIKSEYNLD